MSTLGERMQDYKPGVFLRPEVVEEKVAALPEHLQSIGRAFLELGDTEAFERLRTDPGLQKPPSDR